MQEAIDSSCADKMQNEELELVDRAVSGDKQALETLIVSVESLVFNLSLRMLGTVHDAEDASQEIIVRIITQLSTFQKKSAFSTWVYRVAINYLINYQKSMFAQRPLSFEMYGADIDRGFLQSTPDQRENVSEELLAEELKMSCTNVMLQCLDAESRCIYVLGTMFQMDSKLCGEILGLTPQAYRQRLSRIRKRMAEFLRAYCGLSATGKCDCKKRVGYAIATHRLDPTHLEYTNLKKVDDGIALVVKNAMEEMDAMSQIFSDLPKYRSSEGARRFINNLLRSENMNIIQSVS